MRFTRRVNCLQQLLKQQHYIMVTGGLQGLFPWTCVNLEFGHMESQNPHPLQEPQGFSTLKILRRSVGMCGVCATGFAKVVVGMREK
jgi:hypothetical protein